MSADGVAIANMALARLGVNRIDTFEDGTAEAIETAAVYDILRQSLLAGHPWSWANVEAELTALAAEAPYPWSYWFQLPADLLAVRAVTTPGVGQRWRLFAENRVAANVASLTVIYAYDVAEAQMPAYFKDALAARIAADCAMPLREDAALGVRLDKSAKELWRNACFVDRSSTGLTELAIGPMAAAR